MRKSRYRIGLVTFPILVLSCSLVTDRSNAPKWSPDELRVVETGSFGQGSERIPRDTFSVTSWNVQYGRNTSEILRALTANFDADVVLLQEVDRMTDRSRDETDRAPRDLPRLLAQRLEMHYAYGIEFQELRQDAEDRPAFTGQLTLSKLPLVDAESVLFENQLADWSRGWLGLLQRRHGGRMFLYARALIGDRALHLYNVHLESQAHDDEKVLQMREILADIERRVSEGEPVIVAGDFNTDESGASPVIKLLRELGFEDPLWERSPKTVVTKRGEGKRLDWIFSHGLVILDAIVAEEFQGSDHRALRVSYRTP